MTIEEGRGPVSGVYPHRPACWLRVHGPDAAGFLQGQFTQDIAGLAPGASAYGLWLDAKGRVQADSTIVRGHAPEEFWLHSATSPGAAVAARLGAFLVADEVEIEDAASAWVAVTLFGGAVAAVPASAPGLRFPARRGVPGALEWLMPAEAPDRLGGGEAVAAGPAGPAALAALAAPAVPGDAAAPVEPPPGLAVFLAGQPVLAALAVERLRLSAGIPAIPADIGPRDLPAEAGLEADALSFTKGCYTGQEVVARLESRGRVRRRLVRVAGAGPVPGALPAGLLRPDGTRAGELRTAVATGEPIAAGTAPVAGVDEGAPADGFIGLALVAADLAPPDGGILALGAAVRLEAPAAPRPPS